MTSGDDELETAGLVGTLLLALSKLSTGDRSRTHPDDGIRFLLALLEREGDAGAAFYNGVSAAVAETVAATVEPADGAKAALVGLADLIGSATGTEDGAAALGALSEALRSNAPRATSAHLEVVADRLAKLSPDAELSADRFLILSAVFQSMLPEPLAVGAGGSGSDAYIGPADPSGLDETTEPDLAPSESFQALLSAYDPAGILSDLPPALAREITLRFKQVGGIRPNLHYRRAISTVGVLVADLGTLSADGILTPAEAEAVRALLLSGRFDDMERRFRRTEAAVLQSVLADRALRSVPHPAPARLREIRAKVRELACEYDRAQRYFELAVRTSDSKNVAQRAQLLLRSAEAALTGGLVLGVDALFDLALEASGRAGELVYGGPDLPPEFLTLAARTDLMGAMVLLARGRTRDSQDDLRLSVAASKAVFERGVGADDLSVDAIRASQLLNAHARREIGLRGGSSSDLSLASEGYAALIDGADWIAAEAQAGGLLALAEAARQSSDAAALAIADGELTDICDAISGMAPDCLTPVPTDPLMVLIWPTAAVDLRMAHAGIKAMRARLSKDRERLLDAARHLDAALTRDGRHVSPVVKALLQADFAQIMAVSSIQRGDEALAATAFSLQRMAHSALTAAGHPRAQELEVDAP